jgi:hypothetical protein
VGEGLDHNQKHELTIKDIPSTFISLVYTPYWSIADSRSRQILYKQYLQRDDKEISDALLKLHGSLARTGTDKIDLHPKRLRQCRAEESMWAMLAQPHRQHAAL